jgi:hypothetical protein
LDGAAELLPFSFLDYKPHQYYTLFEYFTRKVKSLQEDLTTEILYECPRRSVLDYRSRLSAARICVSIIGTMRAPLYGSIVKLCLSLVRGKSV